MGESNICKTVCRNSLGESNMCKTVCGNPLSESHICKTVCKNPMGENNIRKTIAGKPLPTAKLTTTIHKKQVSEEQILEALCVESVLTHNNNSAHMCAPMGSLLPALFLPCATWKRCGRQAR